MKKVICVLLLVMLCACSGKRAVAPQIRGIAFDASVTLQGGQYECHVTVDQDLKTYMTVTKPEDISGLCFIFTNAGVTAEYLGLSYTPQLDAMPSGAATKCLFELLQDAASKNTVSQKNNGNYLIKGKLQDCGYTLMIAPSGLPICAEIPDLGLKTDFKNVTVQ